MQQLALTYEPELTADEAAVWSVIRNRKGRAAAIPMPDLAYLVFGSNHSTRRVQSAVHELRLKGYAVGSSCAKPNGYYLITDRQELKESIAQLDHRIQNLSRCAAALRRRDAELAGQRKFEV
jgi:hypothetical protein